MISVRLLLLNTSMLLSCLLLCVATFKNPRFTRLSRFLISQLQNSFAFTWFSSFFMVFKVSLASLASKPTSKPSRLLVQQVFRKPRQLCKYSIVVISYLAYCLQAKVARRFLSECVTCLTKIYVLMVFQLFDRSTTEILCIDIVFCRFFYGFESIGGQP